MTVSVGDGVSIVLVQPNLFRGPVEPSSGVQVGDLWVDTSGGTPVLKQCNSITPITFVQVDTGGGGGGGIALAAGTQTATTNTVVFANSNGITFGMSGSTRITASHNGITQQSTQPALQSLSAGTTRITTGEVVLSNSNGISFGVNGNTVTASYTVPTQTQFVLSNSNNVSFGTNGSTVTATATFAQSVQPAIQSISAGTTRATTGEVIWSNSNGISFGMNANTVTASYTVPNVPAQTNQTLGLYAVSNTTGASSSTTVDARSLSFQGAGVASVGYSNGSVVVSVPSGGGAGDGYNILAAGTQTATTAGTVAFVDSNGISFGMSGSTRITASYTVPSTAGLLSNINVSAGTTSNNLSALTFSNSNGVSFGLNGSVVTGSHNGITQQSTQPVAISGSNGSFAFSTATFGSSNGMHFYSTNGSIVGSYTVPTVTNSSLTISDNATSGTVARLAFTNLNGVTLSLSTTTGGSHTLVGSHNGLTSQSNQAFSAQGGSSAFQTLIFTNSNGISFSNTNGSIWGSHNGITSQSNQVITMYATSNTTQSSTGTQNASSLIFAGAGIASVGVTNGSVVVSVPSGGGGGDGGVFAGVSTAGNTAGSTGTVSTGNFVLVGSGPISLSQSTGAAGSAATVSIIGPATSSLVGVGGISISTNGSTISISNGTMSAYAVSNTTQSSSGTVSPNALSFQGAGGVSVGVSNGSVVISGAAAGGGAGGTATMWWPFNEGVNVAGQQGNATWHFCPLPTPPTAEGGIVSIDRVCFPIVVTNSTNSTGTVTVSMSMGLYTRTASSISLAHSTTGTLAVTYSGTVNNSTYAGIRLMTIPWTTTFDDGRYYVAVASRTTTGGTNCTVSQMLNSQINSNFSGLFGANSNRSHQWPMGLGVYSASSTGFPSSIAFSQIDGTASLVARPPSWFMVSGTA